MRSIWRIIRILLSCLLTGIIFISGIKPALAFCGFYVAKADSSLYNQASQVIIARNENITVLTMSNDYQGDVKDFAMVVPVPVVLTKKQVSLKNSKILSRLDAFSAPRLVEYFDSNPCDLSSYSYSRERGIQSTPTQLPPKPGDTLGVTVEEKFSVGEYDILILSAKESDGLETWLTQNGYKIPSGARDLLQAYIRQGMKFFVAKVNLKQYNNSGFEKLRPISIAYESPKFMLPIRLGMSNANGEQDLIVYLLSSNGQVELTNYRTVKIPSDTNVPEFIQAEFKDFYIALFQKAYQREDRKVAFLEYAWDMGSCDPCAADPLTPEELKQAGVFWLNQSSGINTSSQNNTFMTRLHIRYSRNTFPEDLFFQETTNKQQFQGRYVVHHPFTGEVTCDGGQKYQQLVRFRQEREVENLAHLTGWNTESIRKKINFVEAEPVVDIDWYLRQYQN
jgi:hypothetical protein